MALGPSKMNFIMLVAKKSPICFKAMKNLKFSIRHLSSLYYPSTQFCLSNIVQFNGKLEKRKTGHFSTTSGQPQKHKRISHTHSLEEEVKILAHTHSDIGWGVKLSAENGYLSWMRNTYIMTLAGVAMINSEVAPLAPVAGSCVFLVAGLNMMAGSISFIYNVRRLKRERHISKLAATAVQIFACIHLLLWYSILLVCLPDFESVEGSLKEELKKESLKDK